MPKVRYSETADAVYVQFQNAKAARTQTLDDRRLVDWAADGSIVGIELLDVSGGVDLNGLPMRADVERLIQPYHFIVFA